MKIVLALLFILLLVSDGILAIYCVIKDKHCRKEKRTIDEYVSGAAEMDFKEKIKRQKELGIRYPEAVLNRRGYTTRGNQLIARNKWAPLMAELERQIERIIRK